MGAKTLKEMEHVVRAIRAARRSGLCLSCKMPGFLLLLLAADLQVHQTGKHP